MKMKIKTKSSAKKRFKVTATGKIKVRSIGKRHLLEHKKSSKKRGKRRDVSLAKADLAHARLMLNI